MATPLHTSASLTAMCTDPSDIVRAWSRSRLLLQEPKQVRFLPEDQGVLIAAHLDSEGLHDVLTAGLESGDAGSIVSAAAGFAHLATAGALPDGDSALVKAARKAVDTTPEAVRPIALGLAYLNRLDAHTVKLATKDTDELEDIPLSVVVLLSYAATMGRVDAAATDVATSLKGPLADDPELLDAILAMLFVPVLPYDLEGEPLKSIENAVITGAAMTGAAPESIPMGKGNQRRAAQNAVRTLLEGIDHNAAAFLRAIAAADLLPKDALPYVAAASWLAHHEAQDPLTSAMEDIALGDALMLTEARRMVGAAHREEVMDAVGDDPSTERLALALALARNGDDEVIACAIDAIARDAMEGILVDEYAFLAAVAYAPDLVATWIQDEHLRPLGLGAAEWFPTEEVLAALLALPIPADTELRAAYAWALAGMGDRAAMDRLNALAMVDDDEEISAALEEAQALLDGAA